MNINEKLTLKDATPLKHVYSAACTITCFPIFYAVQKMNGSDPSILEKMQKANKP